MTRKIILACLLAGATAACVTTGMDTPEAQRGKEIVGTKCIITRASSAAYSDKNEFSNIHVMGIEYSSNGWVRFDVASDNVRGNVYHLPMSGSTTCGTTNWRKTGIRFDRISKEAYVEQHPIHWQTLTDG